MSAARGSTGLVKLLAVALGAFAFTFALALGNVWEIFEFGMDRLFGLTMQKPMAGDPSGLTDTMWDLITAHYGRCDLELLPLVASVSEPGAKIVFGAGAARTVPDGVRLRRDGRQNAQVRQLEHVDPPARPEEDDPSNLAFDPETLQAVFTRVFGEDRTGLDQRWRAYMRGLKTDTQLILEESE